MDRGKIYTYLGWFINDTNQFKTIDGELIDCVTYRHLNREMSTQLVAVNMQYIAGYINNWVIFQITSVDSNVLES